MPIPVDTNSADIDTTMALRQQGALQSETASLYQTIRQFGSGTGVWTTDTRALRIASVGMAEDDQWYETDTGWLYRYEGASWKYALGKYTGTNAQRAAISPTSSDNGAWFYATDTERLWQVSSAAWVERVIVSKKMLETAGPTVLTYGAVADGEYLKRSGTNVVGSAVGGGSPAPSNSTYVVISADGTLTDERVLTGTANQITITDGGAGAAVTLSLPQNIHTAATPQFSSLGLGGAAGAAGTLKLYGATSGSIIFKTAAVAGSNTLTFPAGTTDFSATGGASQVVKQTSAGGAFTVAQLAASDLSNGTSGSGAVALVSSPSFTTPTLGAATATTINGLTITTSTGTLTITNGKTLSVSNTLTFTGTDGSSVAFGAGGTVVYTNVTTLSSLVSVGTITTGTWSATTIAVDKGGTGLTSYAVGDLLYASAGTTLSKLADVAAGSFLRSGGVTTAPAWSTVTLPNSATTGDVLYASASNVYSNLADVATGNALISGGVTTAPSWGKIGLTTHVSGTLAVGNGGTGVTTSTGSGDNVLSASPTLTGTITAATANFSGVVTSSASNGVAVSSSTNAFFISNFSTTSAQGGVVMQEGGATKVAFQFNGSAFGTAARQNWFEFVNVTATGGISLWVNTTQTLSLFASGNLKLAGTALRATTEGTNHLDIFNGTAPAGTLTNGISIYSAAGEGRIMDAAGNDTLLSPHDKQGRWIHDEVNFKGRRLRVDMERLMLKLDEMLGGGYVRYEEN